MCARISILADAVNYSLYRVVPRLLSKGAKPRKAATAAAAGDIEFFETTSALHGETINEINLAEDDSGSTYLMVACRAGNNTFVDYLLDKCVAMPLHHAVLLPCLPLLPWHTASDRLQHCSLMLPSPLSLTRSGTRTTSSQMCSTVTRASRRSSRPHATATCISSRSLYSGT